MEYRKLGNTGLEAGVVGFGAEWIGKLSDEGVRELLDFGHSHGVNLVDCWMSDPDIRTKLGHGLAPYREDWIIQGHIGSTWADGQYVRTRDLDKVRPAFEDLLERLQTDHIEIGMIHYVDAVDEFESIMSGDFFAYVQELLAEGKIGHVGLSTHNVEVAQKAVDDGRIEVIMFSINPAFDMLPANDDINVYFETSSYHADELTGIDAAREKLYGSCVDAGVALTVMKPYAGGRLLDAEKSAFGVALTPVQCLHYCLTRPAVASVLAGVENVEQLADAVAYDNATPEQKDYASVLADAPRHAYYGQCTYCGHCAPCTVGIDIASVNKFYDLAVMQDEIPVSVKAHYEALPVGAGECIACGQCEPRCPFGVPIIERMDQAATLFGR